MEIDSSPPPRSHVNAASASAAPIAFVFPNPVVLVRRHCGLRRGTQRPFTCFRPKRESARRQSRSAVGRGTSGAVHLSCFGRSRLSKRPPAPSLQRLPGWLRRRRIAYRQLCPYHTAAFSPGCQRRPTGSRALLRVQVVLRPPHFAAIEPDRPRTLPTAHPAARSPDGPKYHGQPPLLQPRGMTLASLFPRACCLSPCISLIGYISTA